MQALRLPPSRFVDDPELAYVVTRARQVHDFWHVLFGCHTNVFGEVALKAVEFVQVGVGGSAGWKMGWRADLSPLACDRPVATADLA